MIHARIPALGLALILWAAAARGGDPLPCVGEVCLGDAPSRLDGIPWTSPSPGTLRRLSARDSQRLATIYKGSYDEIAPALTKGVFDRRVLGELGRIQAACRPHDLVGKYVSPGGHPTRVTLRLLPDEAGAQAWRVVAISREFPEATSRAQQQEIQNLLDARYGRYSMHRHPPQPGEASYLYSWIGRPMMLLNLTLPPPSAVEARLALHPLCGKRPSLGID